MTFDFAQANTAKLADEPQEMEILHFGTQEPLGVFLMVKGYESETFKALARQETNAERRRAFEAARRGKSGTVRTIEDDAESGIRLSAALLTGWRTVKDGKSEPVIYHEGKPLQFNPTNAAWFLREFDWVLKQVNEFAGEIGNFTAASSTSSPSSPATTST